MPAKNFYYNCGFNKIDINNDIEIWKHNLNNKYDFPDFINYKVL